MQCLDRLFNMKSKLCSYVLPALFSVFFVSCSLNTEKITVAVILPNVGSVSEMQYVIEGLELAVDDINAHGGVNGKQIDMLISQCKLDVESGRQVFEELEKNARPLLYITATDLLSRALSPVATKYSVVLGSLASPIPAEIEKDNWTFTYFSHAEQEVLPIIQMLEKLQIKKLGIFYQNDQSGRLHEEKIRKSFAGAGKEVFSESFEFNSPGSVRGSTLPEQSDAIYVTGFTDNLKIILQFIEAANYSGIILADSGMAGLNLLSPGYNDIYLAAPGIYTFNNDYVKSTKERYEARYLTKFTHFAANSYDFINIIAASLENKPISRESLRSQLINQFSYPGLFGYLEKNEGEFGVHYLLYSARVIDGEIRYLE